MATPYSAMSIANAFLTKAMSEGQQLSPMKLQKLIYFAHAFHLAVTDQPLFHDKVYAWPYGPVVESVYHEFKGYGSRAISTMGTSYVDDPDNPESYGTFIIPQVEPTDGITQLVIAEIWNKYGHMSATQLSAITHEPGSAWGKTESQHDLGRNRSFELYPSLIRDCMKYELGIS